MTPRSPACQPEFASPDRAPLDRSVADPDLAARVRLAAAGDSSADLLNSLASDKAVTVRAAVALNPVTPASTQRTLADDPDPRVRALVARRLATIVGETRLPPGPAPNPYVIETLTHLVEDAAVRVRAAIADALAELPDAPRELVLRLAHDAAMPVSEPIVRLSPLLTTEDLLALLGRPPTAETAIAVARRPHLTEAVSCAIASSNDEAAIRALLANPSAAIQEETLDALIARAARRTDWHESLVLRPGLSPRAAQALASFVAKHLLHYLARRPDLDPGLVTVLRDKLDQRLTEEARAAENVVDQRAKAPAAPGERDRKAIAAAEAHAARGNLTEATLIAACREGNGRLVAAMLALAADVPLAAVDRASALRSGRAVLALLWKGGFSMRAAASVQAILTGRPASAFAEAGPIDKFPLDTEEMRWQLDGLARAGA